MRNISIAVCGSRCATRQARSASCAKNLILRVTLLGTVSTNLYGQSSTAHQFKLTRAAFD